MAFQHLSPSDGQRLNARLADLRTFADAGLALLTGVASTFNDHAMAKAASNGKTKLFTGSERRFGNFQATLDDAARLIRLADPTDVFHGKHREIAPDVLPANALVQADKHTDEVRGQTTLGNAFRALQYARGIYINLKAKYGDALHAPATLTLEGKPKKKKDPAELSRATQARTKNTLLGEMLVDAAARDATVAAVLDSMLEKLEHKRASTTATLEAAPPAPAPALAMAAAS